jgi:hypothetical protein
MFPRMHVAHFTCLGFTGTHHRAHMRSASHLTSTSPFLLPRNMIFSSKRNLMAYNGRSIHPTKTS